MTAAAEELEPRFGYHKGLPVLSQSAMIQKGSRVISQTMDVAPFDVDPGGMLDMSMRLVQTKERFDNVMSKDDPGKLIGFERVVIFDALGAVPDDRTGTASKLDTMIARVADAAEKAKNEKAGQMRLKGVEPVPADDDDPDGTATVREIRSGVPDDQGAGEPSE